MFADRKDAGEKLGAALRHYRSRGALVMAIPRGGAEVGRRAALSLESDFSIIVVRKLPFPGNPEAGFGAVAEDGSTYIAPFAAGMVSESEITEIIEEQKKEILRRKNVLRGGREPPSPRGKTVILVDDGIAAGSTMRAAIKMCRNSRAARIVAAAPVAGPAAAEEISRLADETVILLTPPFFRAVAQAYERWYDVSDEEVIEIMSGWQGE